MHNSEQMVEIRYDDAKFLGEIVLKKRHIEFLYDLSADIKKFWQNNGQHQKRFNIIFL